MLMKCDLYTQSHFKLTQDSSSHKGTPLPICTVTENHREVQFKLFPVEPLSGWGPRPLASLGSPCSRRVIRVLRDLQSHIGKVETGVRPAGNFLERRPKPACQSHWLWPEWDTSSQGADARAQFLELQGQEGCLQVTVGTETRTVTAFPWRPQSL